MVREIAEKLKNCIWVMTQVLSEFLVISVGYEAISENGEIAKNVVKGHGIKRDL